jgi:hypothetical protein
MTVRVNKSPINIREKLNELDYDRVPYDKMPAGSVIRTEHKEFDTRLSINHSGTLQFYDFSDLNITMSPFSAASKFLMQANVVSGENRNPNGGPAFRYYINGEHYYGNSPQTYSWYGSSRAFVAVDDIISSSQLAGAPYLSKTYHGTSLVEPNTTDPVTFKLGFHGSDSIDINRNYHAGGTNNYGSGWTTLTVMEIAG